MPLLFVGFIGCYAYYARWEATKLLRAAWDLTPGKTSEAETLRLIKPFQRFQSVGQESINGGPYLPVYHYAVSNYPRWVVFNLAPHIPYAEHIFLLPWTTFDVRPTFEGGLLSKLKVGLGQPPREGGHVFLGQVTEFSRRFDAHAWELDGREFPGYSIGGMLGDRPIQTRVQLDERATPLQREKAFEFNLHCMTSIAACDNASMILQPVE